MTKNSKPAGVPALEKAFEILDFITASPQAVSAATIAKELKLARSTTHNLLQTLTNKGILHKDNNHLFSLGSYLLYWAGRFEERQGVIALFHEFVVGFQALLPYTVTLSTIDFERGETVFLSNHQGSSVVDFVFRAGVRVPAVFSATGKAILSQLPFDQVVANHQNNFPQPMTDASVANFAQLQAEFEQINKTRLSLDNGQLRLGMYCIGTFIRSLNKQVKLGIAVSMAESEYHANHEQVGQALINLAQMIQNKLGIDGD